MHLIKNKQTVFGIKVWMKVDSAGEWVYWALTLCQALLWVCGAVG